MPTVREAQHFPTRNYPYHNRPDVAAGLAADQEAAPKALELEPGKIHSFVLGLDAAPRVMTDSETAGLLRDPFAELLLKRGDFPLTLRNLLAALDALNADPAGLPKQRSFLVADGGQIPWTPETADVNRRFRFAVTRSRDAQAEMLISASTVPDSDTHFLQLLAWDPINGVFNYYQRLGAAWIWAGNSFHALDPATRGRGPFDSHVNGSLVMKELRLPWSNWHSMAAQISPGVLAPDDPLRDETLFTGRTGAEVMETTIVRPGINRWNKSRLGKATSDDGRNLSDVRFFLRQILETTTVNLTSTSECSAGITDETTLRLPPTFFLNSEALVDSIELDPQIEPITVSGRLYRESLARYEFSVTDGRFRKAGDTFFAFLLPEPAFEDLDLLALLLQERIISKRFAACLLMVDFQNPILSERRRQLMAYVPDTAVLADTANSDGARSDIEAQFAAAVERAAPGLGADSPEAEFLANWRLAPTDWKRSFEQRIERYFSGLKQQAATAAGFDGWVRLAESRRREFSRRPLAEFRLTIPTTNIPPTAAALAMNDDGTVQATGGPVLAGDLAGDLEQSASIDLQEERMPELLTRFDPPGFLDDFNDEQKAAWSDFISEQFDEAAQGRPDILDFDGPREQFFNPMKVATDADAKSLDISWVAFPRNVTVNSVSETQRWRRADASRDVQDEYCEWSVERDPNTDKITRVTFTCEGPEYWDFLANSDPDKALALYRKFVNPAVLREDLFGTDGRYNPRNKWNSGTVNGAMHLIQVNNSLGAEIELAAGSSVVRVIDGRMLTGEQELIRCGAYGGVERHSDPHIGAVVNSLTQQKADVTLQNPVGLYLAGLNTAGWETPDGSNPALFWTYVRGTAEKPVRAVYEVPKDRGFVVGDIKINGRPIGFAAQIVDFIMIKLTGVATRFGKSTAQPMTGCRRRKQAVAAGLAAETAAPSLSVREHLSADWRTKR
jgi:hypothetical protein